MYAVLLGQIRVLVYVYLVYPDLLALLTGDVLENGGQCLAGAAPRRPKVDQDGFILRGDYFGKAFFVQVNEFAHYDAV